MIFYTDYAGGNNKNGGTSFNVLASGSDGVSGSAWALTQNLYSASANFTQDLVGHGVGLVAGIYTTYAIVSAVIDANNLTLSPANRAPDSGVLGFSPATGIQYKIGGRWKVRDQVRTDAADQYGTSYGVPSASNLLPGDEVREIATPYPNSLGDAQWSNYSAQVVFASPVALNVDNCEAAWTIANSAVASATATRRLGATSSRFVFPATRVANTKYWYKTLAAPLDMSSWQRLCFWMYQNSGAVASLGAVRLCLCSDTLGNTIVAEATFKALPQTTSWYPQTLDFGAALPSNVQSIAIYTGATTPASAVEFWINNMIAVKPAGDAKEFTLATLIGKVHNSYWQASQAYASNTIRKPTPPKRNGFRYQITTAGTSGALEPIWPEAEGATVTDGTAVWTCEGPEDTWYPLLNLAGGNTATVDFGNQFSNPNTAPQLPALFTETESVETFGRSAAELRFYSSSTSVGWTSNAGYGTTQQPNKISGGWRRSDMAVQDGETWFDAGSLKNVGASLDSTYTEYDNISAVRSSQGIVLGSNSKVSNCHANGNINGIIQNACNGVLLRGAVANRNNQYGIYDLTTAALPQSSMVTLQRVRADGNGYGGAILNGRRHSCIWTRWNGYAQSGVQAGAIISNDFAGPLTVLRLTTGYNRMSGLDYRFGNTAAAPDIYLIDPLFVGNGNFEAVAPNYGTANRQIFQNYNRVAGDHRVVAAGAQMVPVTATEFGDDRRTASGYAWRVDVSGSWSRTKYNPFIIPFKVALPSGSTSQISVWVKKASGQAPCVVSLVCLGGALPGIPLDIVATASNTYDTYQQLLISVTPDQSGVVDVELQCYYDDIGDADNWYTSHFFFDDFLVEQA